MTLLPVEFHFVQIRSLGSYSRAAAAQTRRELPPRATRERQRQQRGPAAGIGTLVWIWNLVGELQLPKPRRPLLLDRSGAISTLALKAT